MDILDDISSKRYEITSFRHFAGTSQGRLTFVFLWSEFYADSDPTAAASLSSFKVQMSMDVTREACWFIQ